MPTRIQNLDTAVRPDAFADMLAEVEAAIVNSNRWRSPRPGQAKGGYTAQPGFSWVGERGPELLSMPKGATVTPIPQHMRAENMMGANGGGTNVTYSINVNAGMGTNGTQVGQEIIKAISQFERGNGRVFARA